MGKKFQPHAAHAEPETVAPVNASFEEVHAEEIARKVALGLRPEQAVQVIKEQIEHDENLARKK